MPTCCCVYVAPHFCHSAVLPQLQSSTMPKHDPRLGPASKELKRLIEEKLPLPNEVVKDVLKIIKACSTEELALLGLHPPPLPAREVVLNYTNDMPFASQLHTVQDIISTLQYNHMPGYYFNVSKARPLPAILATAAAILRDPLPIKCIEAVFLGILLTQGWGQGQLQRIPIGFKSMGADKQVYRHIVLAVRDTANGMIGGLGISRRDNLMYKPLTFHSLADLVADYKAAYSGWGHQLLKVRVGLPVEHDKNYTGPVCWRYCTANLEKRSWESIVAMLNQHATNAEKLQAKFRAAAAHCSPAGRNSSSSPTLLPPQPHLTRPYHRGSSHASHAPDAPGVAALVNLCTEAALPTSPLTPRLASRKAPNILRSSCPAAVCNQSLAGKQAGSGNNKFGGCSSLNMLCSSSGGHSTVASSIGTQQDCQQQQHLGRQQPRANLVAVCDSSSEEEAEFDSDSEISAIVDSMRHRSPRRECA